MQEDSDQYKTLREWAAFHNLPLKPAYTVTEVARMFDVSKRTVQQWVADGLIETRNVPGRSKIFASHLEEILSKPAQKMETQSKKDALPHTGVFNVKAPGDSAGGVR